MSERQSSECPYCGKTFTGEVNNRSAETRMGIHMSKNHVESDENIVNNSDYGHKYNIVDSKWKTNHQKKAEG